MADKNDRRQQIIAKIASGAPCPPSEVAELARLHKELEVSPAVEADPEDSIDYEGLKASVGHLHVLHCRRVRQAQSDVGAAELRLRLCQTRLILAKESRGYSADVCGVHDIDIPEDDA